MQFENKREKSVELKPYHVAKHACLPRVWARLARKKVSSDGAIFGCSDLREHFKKFLADVAGYAPNVTLLMASRMLSDYRYKVKKEYTSLLHDYYNTSVSTVDFKERYEGVRVESNAWVSKHTGHKIKNLLPPGSINAGTTKSVTVPMMRQMGYFKAGHSEELKSRALEMPYRGGKCSMVILLPDEMEGLSLLEEKLSESSLRTLLASLKVADVHLAVPKISLKAGQSMKDTLRAVGVKQLFEKGRGSVRNLRGCSDVFVRMWYTRCGSRWTKEGTEAAAATAAIGAGSAAPSRDVSETHFVVDHPFMFLVRSIDPDVLLFVGSVRKF
ncbi:hypothetical protein MTO96_007148 [Rhipicephalus appendiculatus]